MDGFIKFDQIPIKEFEKHFLFSRALIANGEMKLELFKTPDVCRSSVFFQMGLLPQNQNHNANEVRLDQKC